MTARERLREETIFNVKKISLMFRQQMYFCADK